MDLTPNVAEYLRAAGACRPADGGSVSAGAIAAHIHNERTRSGQASFLQNDGPWHGHETVAREVIKRGLLRHAQTAARFYDPHAHSAPTVDTHRFEITDQGFKAKTALEAPQLLQHDDRREVGQ